MASSIRTLNPATGKIEQEFDAHTPTQINQFIENAHSLYATWKTTSFEDRAQIIKKVAHEMRQQKAKLALLITTEMGKPLRESEIEIDYCANIFDYYADNAQTFLANKTVETEKGKAFVISEPTGVLLGIMPWNFPFSQITRFIAPNLMAGNTVVLKTASNIPQCGIALEELFTKIGAPKGLYTNLLLAGRDTSELVKDKRIVGVSLTGSDTAGASVAKIAGEYVKKSVLELGGTDPMIVLDDADITKVLNGTINGRLRNAGQACTSSKRILVQEGIYDEYLAKITAHVHQLKVDDPLLGTTDMGPVSSQGSLDTLLEQVRLSVEAGATLVTGGNQIKRDGSFMEPTILTNIQPGMPAYDQEVFGPVVCIIKFKTIDEATHLANDTIYGLGSSIYTEDKEKALQIASQIDAGMVYINKQVSSSPELPFGGTKRSGYGRELSQAGIQEFLNKKLVMMVD